MLSVCCATEGGRDVVVLGSRGGIGGVTGGATGGGSGAGARAGTGWG